ncbi:MAG: 2-methylthioadenine synthetase [Clostridiaceae bacterium]|jgi:hypothetical protein|nr:2-methylthioadenine synthetase [Clostridiaceae bacterium]
MNYNTITIVLLVTIIIFLVLKLKNISKGQTPGLFFIALGGGLISSSFPSLSDRIINLGEKILVSNSIPNLNDTNYTSLISGFILIVIGIYYNQNVKDRFFLLNILSKDRRLINDKNTIKELNVSDFKLKECQIDVVTMFNDANNMTQSSCKYIAEEIEEKTKDFISQSNDFKKAFTGMFSIPFTILAGTYLSATGIDEYFEYNRNKNKYYSLKVKKWSIKKGGYPCLNITTQNTNVQSSEVIVAISITKNVTDGDLIQFGNKDSIKIELQSTGDNVIEYREQLDGYTKLIVDTIENLKATYSNLETVHLVGAIPSCLSIELGRRISLNRNRLPQIISYHFKYGNTPKYSFGLVVTEKDKGKLIEV